MEKEYCVHYTSYLRRNKSIYSDPKMRIQYTSSEKQDRYIQRRKKVYRRFCRVIQFTAGSSNSTPTRMLRVRKQHDCIIVRYCNINTDYSSNKFVFRWKEGFACRMSHVARMKKSKALILTIDVSILQSPFHFEHTCRIISTLLSLLLISFVINI